MSDYRSSKFFDLYITGLGYVNRVREIVPENSLPFIVVSISALRGENENVRYTHLECRVVGRDASAFVRELAPYVEQGDRVLIRFRTSDLYGETFTHKHGSKAGQVGVSLKTRLFGIEWAKVNGSPFSSLHYAA